MYAICPKNLRFLVKKAKFTKLNFSQGGSAEISLILVSYQPNGILTGSIFTFFGSFQKSFFLLRDSVLCDAKYSNMMIVDKYLSRKMFKDY